VPSRLWSSIVADGAGRKTSHSGLRVVADTMVWVSATVGRPGSASRALFDAFARSEIKIVTSGPFVRELADVLIDELDHPRGLVEQLIALICARAEIVMIRHQVMGCSDPKDDPILETALTADVDFIVTLDQRLLHLPPHVAKYVQRRGVKIIKPGDFAVLLRTMSPEDGGR